MVAYMHPIATGFLLTVTHKTDWHASGSEQAQIATCRRPNFHADISIRVARAHNLSSRQRRRATLSIDCKYPVHQADATKHYPVSGIAHSAANCV